ncbi:MAG: DUF3553 domain-containing protein [Acetobacteraceae bacterium]|nr:DUF3553 domain-containing protein [Acetobacteraceae bacterium]
MPDNDKASAGFGQANRPFVSGVEPGQFVRHPTQPDWGDGQVQSVIGSRITVNFEHAGKVLINALVVNLQIVG